MVKTIYSCHVSIPPFMAHFLSNFQHPNYKIVQTLDDDLIFIFIQNLHFRSSHYLHVSFLSRVKINSTNWPAPNLWVFIAQMVEHCSAKLHYNNHYGDHIFIKVCISEVRIIFMSHSFNALRYIYSIFTALVETMVSHIEHIHIYIYKEEKEKKKTKKTQLNYTKEKKILQWGRTRREHTNHSSKSELCVLQLDYLFLLFYQHVYTYDIFYNLTLFCVIRGISRRYQRLCATLLPDFK